MSEEGRGTAGHSVDTTAGRSGRRETRRIYHEGRIEWGEVRGGDVVLGSGETVPCADAMHLPPVTPGKIICVHLNYDDRRVELGQPEPERFPSYFLKPATSLTGHDGTVYRPRDARLLNYEGEVAVVIGSRLRRAELAEAEAGIAGYAAANDVGCHDFRGTDRGSMLRVKGMDGFCCIGPGVVSGIDISESEITTYLNGRVVQHTAVSEMVFSPAYMIADLSRYITLEPGDVILSGTPRNSRPMSPGDVLEVEVTGVGRLRNVVKEAPSDVLDVGFPAQASTESSRVSLGSDFQPDQADE